MDFHTLLPTAALFILTQRNNSQMYTHEKTCFYTGCEKNVFYPESGTYLIVTTHQIGAMVM